MQISLSKLLLSFISFFKWTNSHTHFFSTIFPSILSQIIHLPNKKTIYIYILRKTMEQQAPNRDKNHPHPRPSAIILEPRVFSTPILSRSGIIIETRERWRAAALGEQRLEGTRGRVDGKSRPTLSHFRPKRSFACVQTVAPVM